MLLTREGIARRADVSISREMSKGAERQFADRLHSGYELEVDQRETKYRRYREGGEGSNAEQKERKERIVARK